METLRSINRCRVFKKILFLSDLVTADGACLEEFALAPTKGSSTYDFPPEFPTPTDWSIWSCFLRSLTCSRDRLHSPLGCWTSASHRIWEWHYLEGSLYHKDKETFKQLLPSPYRSLTHTFSHDGPRISTSE